MLPLRREICATREECCALAQRFHFMGLSYLRAILEISPWKTLGVRVNGELQARVIQRCVISLEPMSQALSHTFVSFFSPSRNSEEIPSEQQSVDLEDPEVIEQDGINLGELVSQQLCLVLDPYPHLPDARLPEYVVGKDSANSPFSNLSRSLSSRIGKRS